MNTYIILLFYVCRIIGGYDYGHYSLSPNVGTVLFKQADLKKERWSKAEICLLRARRHFQKLIPPPASLQTTDANFVNKLIKYFHNTYSSVKREANDPQTDRIMTTALSDAIGGYLKVWVLPVAKYGYYGGTVNQQDIMKLYQFYQEIQSYLHNDGRGWRSPDGNLMKTFTINIAPTKHSYNTRSMRNPCEHLAFFEKTEDGLSVPMPFVNWNDKSSTMFIPLKNESLVYLTSPNSTTSLFKYYDVAKNCLERSKPVEQTNFEDKFQNWVTKDIVPHLEDDNLYLALWSVLSLMNKSDDLSDFEKPSATNDHKFVIGGYTIDLSQKKVLLLLAILIFEIAWCIPALVYMLLKKKRVKDRDICLMVESASDVFRKPNNRSDIDCYRKPRKHALFEHKNVGSDPVLVPDKKTEKKAEVRDNCCQGDNLLIEPRIRHVDVETNQIIKNSVGLGSSIHYSSKMCSTNNKIVREPSAMAPIVHQQQPSINKVCKKKDSEKLRNVCVPRNIQKVLKPPSKVLLIPCPVPDPTPICSSREVENLSMDDVLSSIDETPSPTCVKRLDFDKREKPPPKDMKSKVKEKDVNQAKEKAKCMHKEQSSSPVKEKVTSQDKEKDREEKRVRESNRRPTSQPKDTSQKKDKYSSQIKDELPMEKEPSQVKERCFVAPKESPTKSKNACEVKEKHSPEKGKCIIKEKSASQGKNKLKSPCKEKQDCSKIYKEPKPPEVPKCPCPKKEVESSEESDLCPCPPSPDETLEAEPQCLCTPCYSSCQYDRSQIKEPCCQPKGQKTQPTKQTRFRVQNEIITGKMKPNKCEKAVREKAHYVEVTIDRPGNEITVGFGGKSKVKAAATAVTGMKTKPSKIPKRTVNEPCCFSQAKPPSPTPVRRSLIPQPKRYTTDDIAIKPKKAPVKDKLNVTL